MISSKWGRAIAAGAIGALLVTFTGQMVAPSVSQAAAHRITYIPINTGNPYFDVVYSGVKAAAGKTGDTSNEIAPSSASATGQIPFIQQAAAQHVDGMMISAADPKALVPAAKAAMAKGIKVITLNNDYDPSGRLASVLPTNFDKIGPRMVREIAKEIHYKGQIAILSANPTAPAQNGWILGMKKELKKGKYKSMTLVKTAFGNDDPSKSFTETQGLLSSYPKLAGILAPTTVAVAAAAQALESSHKNKKIALLGLGLPNQMRKYVKDGTTPRVLLWNPAIQGSVAIYLMDGLIDGSIKPHSGGTFQAGQYGTMKFLKDNVVDAAPLLVFTKKNVDKYHF